VSELDANRFPALAEIASAVYSAPLSALREVFPVNIELYARGSVEVSEWAKENGRYVLCRTLAPMQSNFIWCGKAIVASHIEARDARALT
jgi:hypothetical protein